MDIRVKLVVVAVHGVESRGDWLSGATRYFTGIDDIKYVCHAYGRFPFWKAAWPGARQGAVDEFCDTLRQVGRDYPCAQIAIVAHSFGTYLVAEALNRRTANVRRVVLCGSIIDTAFDWPGLMAAGILGDVRNETAGRDWVVKVFRSLRIRAMVPGAGPSGVDGFSAGVVEQQHFEEYGHNSFTSSPDHGREHWLPYLFGTRAFRDHCRACIEGDPEAWRNFEDRYGTDLAAAVDLFFGNVPIEGRAVYRDVLRWRVIEGGAAGERAFDSVVKNEAFRLKSKR
jgi:pimeloyl-ACP methyl ester carboxylesterase